MHKAEPAALPNAVAKANRRPSNAKPSKARKIAQRLNALFFASVVLPTAVAGVYFGAFASDIYVSEARFLVRNPQRPQTSGLGALLQGTAFSRAQDDTYSVHDFIRSRDALREIDARVGFRTKFSRPTVDFVNRFPGIDPDDSFEALHRYYQKQVNIDYDTVSGISILRVHGFDAQSALQINTLLLEMGEKLVNNMNMRARRDLIEVAESEVSLAEARSKAAAESLSTFRADQGVLDPDRQGAIQLQGVLKLREELFAAETQLNQVRQVSPDNPQISSLKRRVDLLGRAIGEENARILGRSGGLVGKSPDYDRLTLEKAFSDRQLATALATLETARGEAQRKQLYLERLVQPHLPDRAVEPRRLRSVFTVFVLGLIAWGVLSLILGGVREHTEN